LPEVRSRKERSNPVASVIANSERRAELVAHDFADLATVWPAAAETYQAALREDGRRRDGLGDLDRAVLVRATMEARLALEEAVAAAAVAAQRAIDVAEALDETLAILAAEEPVLTLVPSIADADPSDVDTLSPREREVLALVAEGRSNKAIAEALFVSPNTIKTHVASLLSKLHAESRVQLAAMAARKGLANSMRNPNAA
jgi:DNA-binding CsgD family transcriptional regulator